MTLKQKAFIALQYIVPQHLLSHLVGWLAASEIRWIKNTFINFFIKQFGINMNEAKRKTADDFRCFNDFFTRELEDDARPVSATDNQLVSPADGAVSQLGKIENGRIFQAKGQDYSLIELLGGNTQRAEEFMGGEFATIYLSPKDYHRVHMPVTGTLREMVYVPGDLFSVNQTTAENVPRLFARNERLVCIFDTEQGPMAMILVGAMIVAAIETVWAGRITPMERKTKVTDYTNPQPVTLEKGEEMGRFLLGSTVVLCFAKDKIHWLEELAAESPLRMGEAIAMSVE
ncbi:MAG: phosphatidylserine decarboxylase [Oceanospirillaceae bacterium]|uniref:archaetidylserine decarboxylase n=1 Tax=unclassified Thalassolituus TaxID=2624967 RepID=UPI000C093A1D|nr:MULTISPECIES: archaetidylserine decarboxylase [unclassified Thalassolituus]MAK92519.1 phosphatidylserine decarboxylase [Thalassolituus sp.]MAS26473.1 phosphatidylserine decarboxylase [Oceanospirillaceae bacterium]MAX98028.1 phosphatidylserine decarboxylase [Oceanospirillaceae bacterium]MBL34433.1 phosphatidylserine decarboxylase [Oceanospirillaceae bacterium]MBS52706.1 phosphatidylserine decarboxylase [Oceanospirillaceae bacterium]|tara:strand:+ start:200 stop:1060 length:861 start_codon:yes stop_codon:yes gene_type:complete